MDCTSVSASALFVSLGYFQDSLIMLLLRLEAYLTAKKKYRLLRWNSTIYEFSATVTKCVLKREYSLEFY